MLGAVAGLAALIVFFGAWVLMLQRQTQASLHWSWWRAAGFVAGSFTAKRWLELFAWGAATGLVTFLGLSRGRVPAHAPRSLHAIAAAAAAGAFIAVSTLSLAIALGRLWPYAESLRDAPAMALVLAVYGMTAPWLCGRWLSRRWLLRRSPPG